MGFGSLKQRASDARTALSARLPTSLIGISALLYLLGAVARYPMAMAVFEFNDTGYHMRIAQLFIENAPQLVHYDPRWRGGILMNYSSLFETIIAIVHLGTGIPLEDLWPVMTLLIWSLIPVAVFLFVRYLGNLVAGVTAGTLAAYPLMLPDQGHMITAVLMALLASYLYFRVLRTRTLKSGLLFGASVALVFWSHFFVLSFFAFVWALYGVAYLLFPWTGGRAYPNQTFDNWGQRIDQKFTLVLEIVYPTFLSVAVFFVLTAEWWIDSYAEYGTNIFNSPLNNLDSTQIILATAYPVTNGSLLSGYTKIIYFALAVSGFAAVGLTYRYLRDRRIDLYSELLEGLSYALAITGLGAVFLYGYRISTLLTYGPVWRYYVFYLLGLMILAGLSVGVLYPIFKTDRFSIPLASATKITFVIFILITGSYIGVTGYEVGQAEKTPTHVEFPSNSDFEAYEWLDQNVNDNAVVTAGAVDSSYLLSFSNTTTLTGHYGHTNPDTDRDRAGSVILWSSNYTQTAADIRKYNISYVVVHPSSTIGIFEAGLVWDDLWKGSDGGQSPQYEKYEYFGERVYHSDTGTSIYRIDRTDLPDPTDGSGVPMETREGWNQTVVGDPLSPYSFTADGSLSLTYRPKTPHNREMFVQNSHTSLPTGTDGVFVSMTAEMSPGVYPRFALEYNESSRTKISTGRIDQSWRYDDTYYGNGTVVYQTYVPEAEGQIESVKVSMIQSEHRSTWRTMNVSEIRIVPMNNPN
ncbi:hypothetical protein DM826_07155 [Halonotius aquaticus]|uniref:Uncharacterized protein n=1 Tax=Halonotius aquaticus TaxID=2216978 RepID=A0A3A6QBQ1_9EURY|nr:hypothetical protein [Halonotius aquaticus]RJX43378.1 hypothetical protein DM826_07155 [Halonotius aquaticus]